MWPTLQISVKTFTLAPLIGECNYKIQSKLLIHSFNILFKAYLTDALIGPLCVVRAFR